MDQELQELQELQEFRIIGIQPWVGIQNQVVSIQEWLAFARFENFRLASPVGAPSNTEEQELATAKQEKVRASFCNS
jgi:hypothetical protein